MDLASFILTCVLHIRRPSSQSPSPSPGCHQSIQPTLVLCPPKNANVNGIVSHWGSLARAVSRISVILNEGRNTSCIRSDLTKFADISGLCSDFDFYCFKILSNIGVSNASLCFLNFVCLKEKIKIKIKENSHISTNQSKNAYNPSIHHHNNYQQRTIVTPHSKINGSPSLYSIYCILTLQIASGFRVSSHKRSFFVW